tara:strand:+ start:753 stop:2207 length:1455 start_codon:yes stop_codon:yes gene_type:complete
MIIPIEEKLSFLLKDFIIDLSGPKHPNLKAILVPHAGLEYSGRIAQWAYNQIDWTKFNKVILLSTHHKSGNYIPNSREFTLGNKTFKLNDLDLHIEKKDEPFNTEHSWLVQMPFLPTDLPITIILVSSYNSHLVNKISDKIDDNTLVIVNTDLLHCGTNYGNKCPHDISNVNQITIKNIINKDNINDRSLCGKEVIKLFIDISRRKCWQGDINYYYNSSDKIYENSNNSSVGYVSIIFTNEIKLLKIPRTIMEWELVRKILGEKISEIKIKYLLEEFMKKTIIETSIEYGIFVTIENNDKLRGCIGQFEPENVGRLIAKQTLISAFRDTRFWDNMITESELPKLSYKINFLNKPVQIYPNNSNKSTYDVVKENLKIAKIKEHPVIGHGITLYFGERRATYLASVLPELGIDIIDSSNFKKLEIRLRNKAFRGNIEDINITKIEIYYCQEFEEDEELNLEKQKGGNINYYRKYKKYKKKYFYLKN